MSRLPTRTVGLALAGFLTFGAAACGGDTVAEKLTEKALEASSGGDADIDLGDGTFSVETDEGSFSVDEDGKVQIDSEDGSFSSSSSSELPDDFPDVPLPDGDLQVSSVTETPEGTNYSASFVVDDDPADVFNELIAAYEDDGYEVEGKSETNSSDGFFGGAGLVGHGDHDVYLSVIGSDGDETLVNMTLSPRAE